MRQIFGTYSLISGDYADSSTDVLRYEDERFMITLQGHVRCGDQWDELSSVAGLYLQTGRSLTERLGGLYILLIYDKREKTLAVFHDRTTSPVTLYYSTDGDRLLIGTSLKTLLRHSSTERRLNENAVETFLINGYIYGKETLVDGVYKLEPFRALTAERGEIRQVGVTYRSSDCSKGQALDRFKPTLDDAIRRTFAEENEIALPLSGGYDSSYIAHIAAQSGRTVNAFSVGGSSGKNELPQVEKNVRYFPNTVLTKAYTSAETMKCFPDIVERLEGAAFEVGIFLQYELMKLTREKEKTVLICGECADQVFNPYFYETDRILPDELRGVDHYEFSEYPYVFGTQLILKKSGIMANSFGIETRYPYLDDEVVALSEPLGEINGKDKRCHVANCKDCLPEEVLRSIAKQGGATDCLSLFDGDAEVRAFFKEIEQTDFYRRHEQLIKRHSYAEQEKQTGAALIKTKLRNFVLSALHIGTESRKRQASYMEEIKLREYLCVAYLAEFEGMLVRGG